VEIGQCYNQDASLLPVMLILCSNSNHASSHDCVSKLSLSHYLFSLIPQLSALCSHHIIRSSYFFIADTTAFMPPLRFLALCPLSQVFGFMLPLSGFWLYAPSLRFGSMLDLANVSLLK